MDDLRFAPAERIQAKFHGAIRTVECVLNAIGERLNLAPNLPQNVGRIRLFRGAPSIRPANKARTQQYFMGFTERIARPGGMTRRSTVSLAEAPRGAAPPIVAWYPPESANGLKFMYRR